MTTSAHERPPSASVLAAFGANEPAVRFTKGRGQTWDAGGLVLKPVEDEGEARWVAELSAALPQHRFRLARPIATREGDWVAEGWSAWTRVEGEHSATRWPELLTAAAAFHDALRNLPKPEFISRQERSASSSVALDRWRVADRIVWGGPVPEEFAQRAPLDALFAARRPVDLPSQIIHGDLVGNVLFAPELPPAIIDLSLYWRPVGYSAALVVGDALVWEGASRDIVQLLTPFDQWPQLLLRAVLFRMIVNELRRRLEPSRADLRAEYRDVVELVRSLVDL